jgi:7-cyano-7-deazaguanine reductase
MTGSPYEGLQNKIKKLKTPKIETWHNIYPERDYVIDIDMPEFTCICPKTGLPDFARISIRYTPDKACIELKSLKYYELFYREVGIFHENVVNRFLEDLVRACKPRWMEVTGEFNPRGGIKTTVRAEYRI